MFVSFFSSRLQPDQKRLKQASSSSAEHNTDSSTSTARDDASRESKSQAHPPLDLAPPISEDDELTPEEIQMVGAQFFCIHRNDAFIYGIESRT